MDEHIALPPIETGHGWSARDVARCSCGWVADGRPARLGSRFQTFEQHREEALKPATNSCRYCASPIPWGRLFCGDVCDKASRKRPDAVAEALAAHREDIEPEVIVPHPDQGALW